MGGFSFLSTLAPRQIAFWSGAGISIDAPTCGPSGRALTDRALGAYFLPGLAADLTALYSQLGIPDAAFRPRLETVLDALTEVYGASGLADVLSDLAASPHNANHEFFAAHMLLGGQHTTENFDACIEEASLQSVHTAVEPVHFHGLLGNGGDVSELGARMGMIENGFPSDVRDALDGILGDPAVEVLVFAGCSGSDYFDATPYLQNRWHLLAGRKVVWHEYSTAPAPTLSGADCDDHHVLRDARAAGVETFRVRDTLSSCLDDLAQAWGLSPSSLRAIKPSSASWSQQSDPSNHLRARATVALLARMGVRHQVIRIIEASGGPSTPEDADRYADALWGAGRYREARVAWRQAFAGNDDTAQARLIERQAAVDWIRGRYLFAQRKLRRALKKWAHPQSSVPIDVQLRLAEAYGRVLVHMRRSPETRPFATVGKTEFATQELVRLGNLIHGHEGIHMRARIASLRAELARTEYAEADGHAEAFSESEALHGWMNYRHAKVRADTARGIWPTRHALDELVRQQRLLGAHGDSARVILLPGATRVYSPLLVWSAFSGVDITTWHRIRVILGIFARHGAWKGRQICSPFLGKLKRPRL